MNNRKLFFLMVFMAIVRRKSSAATALFAVAVGGAVLLGMSSLYIDAPRQMERQFRAYGANMVLTGTITEKNIVEVKKLLNHIEDYKVIGATPFLYEDALINDTPVTLVKTAFEEAVKTNPFWTAKGSLKELVIGTDVAAFMNLAVGDTAELNGEPLTVGGIISTGGAGDGYIYANFGDNKTAEILELSIALPQEELKTLSGILAANTGLTARLVTRIADSEASVLGKLRLLIQLVTFVVLVLTMISVGTTMTGAVLERQTEIALKKALGGNAFGIAMEFLFESVILGFIGGCAGAVMGTVFARAASASIFGSAIRISLPLYFYAIVISIIVTVVASILPIRGVGNIEPAVVLKGNT